MTVFISHSFADQAVFDNVTDWLDLRGVPYWKPAEIKAGASLRGQLRDAIGSCSVCVFIATHNSVKSSWCGAELGAFWGADIPVIVYMADSSLPDEALPPILQSDAWEGRLSRIASRAAELDADRSAKDAVSPGDKITSMTVEQLEKIIAGAVSLVQAGGGRGVPVAGQATSPDTVAEDAAKRILRAADATSHFSQEPHDTWCRRILWADDRPDNNTHIRDAFESLGLAFDLALSTNEAVERLRRSRYGAIISDMARPEGPREGYRLLDTVRASDSATPFFIYSRSKAPEHVQEAVDHGAQGVTNSAYELVDMVSHVLSLADSTST
ncbi:response regulator [Nocardia nova SH22a]|uniref:Response regulator n=1 Tax=Nocardia nova SH22a TaxID=1415166 RepID=W5TA16_9NOCA|nr:TIR domain-containing protein [Nocardia nova]AHH16042.1 response regulator [Nocardia nova SH22a]